MSQDKIIATPGRFPRRLSAPESLPPYFGWAHVALIRGILGLTAIWFCGPPGPLAGLV